MKYCKPYLHRLSPNADKPLMESYYKANELFHTERLAALRQRLAALQAQEKAMQEQQQQARKETEKKAQDEEAADA